MTDAQVVYEQQDAYDLAAGPYGYKRVGVRFGDRVIWLGTTGMGHKDYEQAELLATEIVRRWRAEALRPTGGEPGGGERR